jgi:hypothetical protein
MEDTSPANAVVGWMDIAAIEFIGSWKDTTYPKAAASGCRFSWLRMFEIQVQYIGAGIKYMSEYRGGD